MSMTNNEIILNGVVIGRVFEQLDGGYEVWIPHILVMCALEEANETVDIEFTH